MLLLVGLAIAVTLFIRTRGHRRGWPGLLYGTGVTTALLLLPYVLRPARCVAGTGTDCYQAFTVVTFAVAVVLALTGLAFAVVEVRGARRT